MRPHTVKNCTISLNQLRLDHQWWCSPMLSPFFARFYRAFLLLQSIPNIYLSVLCSCERHCQSHPHEPQFDSLISVKISASDSDEIARAFNTVKICSSKSAPIMPLLTLFRRLSAVWLTPISSSRVLRVWYFTPRTVISDFTNLDTNWRHSFPELKFTTFVNYILRKHTFLHINSIFIID